MSDDAVDPKLLPTQQYADEALQRARNLLDALPEQIGPYRILERIGGGGMGEVFRAEQRHPIRREVALKFIKLGMDTKSVIARFEAERQALALMDHPHIAKVLDAGTDDTGRPFFVMEYVKGNPITEYADKNQLTIAERLELVEQVCQAIQHAHHKGVIHRDLKPSNVLVSTHDGKPFAKVIDFGIAKAIGQQLTDKTLFTLHAEFIGTPQYMSPEQAEGSLDIDTRTDVYSLGVLLYELLTGTPPFSAAELKLAAWEQFRKQIIEVDPPKPSLRLSASGPALPTLATSRRTEPKRLGNLVRGELDWIVMKALDKDRKRRYETPTSLANDLQAYLAGEPVQAAPPSFAYRVRKFVRRYRGAVFATSALIVMLLFGIVGTAWGLRRAMIAEQQMSGALDDLNRQVQETEHELKNILPQSLLDEAQESGYQDFYKDPETPASFEVDMVRPVKRDDGTLLGYTKLTLGQQGIIGDVEILNPEKTTPDGMDYVRILGQFAADRAAKWRRQLKESQAARDSAQDAQKRSEELLYRSGIQLAYEMLTSGQILDARITLDALPEHLRGWEWKWLKAETTGPLDDFILPEDEMFVAYSENGRFAVVRKRKELNGPFRLFEAKTHHISDPINFPNYEQCFAISVANTGRVAILAIHPFTPEEGDRSSIYVWDPSEQRVIFAEESGVQTHRRMFTAMNYQRYGTAGPGAVRLSSDGTKLVAWGMDYSNGIISEKELKSLIAYREGAQISGVTELLRGEGTNWNMGVIYDIDSKHVVKTFGTAWGDISGQAQSSMFLQERRTSQKLLSLSNGMEVATNSTSPFTPVSPGQHRPYAIVYNGSNRANVYDATTGGRLREVSLHDDAELRRAYHSARMGVVVQSGRLFLRNLEAGESTLPIGYAFAESVLGVDEESSSLFEYDMSSKRMMRRFPLLSVAELALMNDATCNNSTVANNSLSGIQMGEYELQRDAHSLQANSVAFYREPYGSIADSINGSYGQYAFQTFAENGRTFFSINTVIDSQDARKLEVPLEWNVKIDFFITSQTHAAFTRRKLEKNDIPYPGGFFQSDTDRGLWTLDLKTRQLAGPVIFAPHSGLTLLGIAHDILWVQAFNSVRGFHLNELMEVTPKQFGRVDEAILSGDGTYLAAKDGMTLSIFTLPDGVLASQVSLPKLDTWIVWADNSERIIVKSGNYSDHTGQSRIYDPVQGKLLLAIKGIDYREKDTLANQSIGYRIPFRQRWPLIQATARSEFDPNQESVVAEKVVSLSLKASTLTEFATVIVQHEGLTMTEKAIAFRLVNQAWAIFDSLDPSDEWLEAADAQAAVGVAVSSGKHPTAVAEILKVLPNLWRLPSARVLNDRAWKIVSQPRLVQSAYVKALRVAQACVKAEPEDAAYVNTLGVAQYRAGQFEQAVNTLQRSEALAQAKQESYVCNQLFIGMAKYRLGDRNTAFELLNKIAQSDQNLDDEDAGFLLETLDTLAAIQLERNDVDGALANWQRLTASQPEESFLRLKMAAVCAWYNRETDLASIRNEAIGLADKTDKVDTAERCAKICCFTPNIDRAQLERSRDRVRAAISKEPNHRYVQYFHLALGMAEYRLGEYESALAEFELIAKNGVTAQTLPVTAAFHRAMSLAQLGRRDEAKSWQVQALQKMRPMPESDQNPLANNANADDIIAWLANRECEALLSGRVE